MDRIQGVVVFNYGSDPEVDLYIWLHTLCSKYGVLPEAGGIFDQDPYVLYGLSAVIRAVGQKEEKDIEKQKLEAKQSRKGRRR
jgi:hypothetical protein